MQTDDGSKNHVRIVCATYVTIGLAVGLCSPEGYSLSFHVVNSPFDYFIRLQVNYIFTCQMTNVFSIHILTFYHNVPIVQESNAPMTEDEIRYSRRVDTCQDLIDRWKDRTRWLISCSRAWLTTGTPIFPVNGQLSGRILVWTLAVKCLFHMAVTTSKVYKFNAEELRQICSNEGQGNEGPVRLLQQRLVCHLTGKGMASERATDTERACAQSDLSLDATSIGPQDHFCGSHLVGCGNVVPVIVEILRPVASVSSDEPGSILVG